MGEPPAYRVLLLATARRSPGERDRIDAALDAALAAADRRGSVRDALITTLRAAELLAESDPAWARAIARVRGAFQRAPDAVVPRAGRGAAGESARVTTRL